MNKAKLSFSIVTLFLLCTATVALAGRGVFNAKVTPNEVFVGSNQTLTITAEITGNGLHLSSATVYQTTAQGQPIANLGQLYDDGTHGDVTLADTIFTTELQVNPPTSGESYYRVTAAFQGDRNRYLSQVFTNTAYNDLRPGIVADTVLALQTLTTNYLESLTSYTVNQARQFALANAQSNPSITTAFLSGNILWIVYENTIHGMTYLTDPNEAPTLNGNEYPTQTGVDIYASYYSGSGSWWCPIWPFDDYCYGISAVANHAQQRFGSAASMHFTPSPPSIDNDPLASFDVINNWGNNAAVVVTTHGGFFNNPNDPTDSNHYVVLLTGVEATQSAKQQYRLDLQSNPPRLGVALDRFIIFPAYISTYCLPMQNTFFYLGACHSLQNNSLWNVLQAKGAKVAFGWSDTVYTSFDSQTFASLIDPMVPNDQTQPLTAQQAFDSIGTKCDSHPSPACLQMRFAGPDWNNFLFSQGGLVNGDFETGDWTGWTHGGDDDIHALVVSAETYSGHYAASIGRWSAAYTGYNPTEEPYGVEYFYQDFVVPANVTHLIFDWWQEGYDTANWDWFDALILDTSGNTLQTLMYHGGKPGLNYGPYWNTATLVPVSFPYGSPGVSVGGGWYEVTADVSAYRGQKIRIYFDGRWDGYGDQTRIFIDDVRLQ